MSYLPLYTTVTILDVCKGEGVFYLMFEVTVSMLPLYTKPLRAYIVELLNAHVVCNLVDLSEYQHIGASLDLDLPVCVDWLGTEQTCQTYEGELNILDFPPLYYYQQATSVVLRCKFLIQKPLRIIFQSASIEKDVYLKSRLHLPLEDVGSPSLLIIDWSDVIITLGIMYQNVANTSNANHFIKITNSICFIANDWIIKYQTKICTLHINSVYLLKYISKFKIYFFLLILTKYIESNFFFQYDNDDSDRMQ